MKSRRRSAYERALAFCRAKKLFRPGDRVLVGTGSGPTSLGVLGFLRLAQQDLALAEVAVGAVDLGGEQDADAVADAGRFARLLGTTFFAVSADGRTITRALLALATHEGYTRIAMGQTRDDAVARVLAGVLGGRGLAHVRPLRPRRKDGVVRPLLDLRDAEAVELARTAGIEPAMMPPEPGARPSLEQRLRTTVLPRLRVEAPGVDTALLTHGDEIRQLLCLASGEVVRRIDGAQIGAGLVEITPVGHNAVLADAVARAALRRLGVAAPSGQLAISSLARLLRTTHSTRLREAVLGPGLVATYVPERGVVALRMMKPRRGPEGVVG